MNKTNSTINERIATIEMIQKTIEAQIHQKNINIEKKRKIGKGLYGNVYAAKIEKYSVAIKVFHPEIISLSKKKESFLTNSEIEAKVSSKINQLILDHITPNVNALIAAIPLSNSSYELVYELADINLQDAIKTKILSQAQLASVVLQLLMTLYTMAKQKMIHNDLYCTNIVLAFDNTKLIQYDYVLNNNHYIVDGNICARIIDWGPQLIYSNQYDEFEKNDLPIGKHNIHVFYIKMGKYCRDIYSLTTSLADNMEGIPIYSRLQRWTRLLSGLIHANVIFDGKKYMDSEFSALKQLSYFISTFPMEEFIGYSYLPSQMVPVNDIFYL